MPPVFRTNRLALYRLVLGIKQQEIARYVGVSGRTVSNWERDIYLSSKDHADRLSKLLRMPGRKLWPHEPYQA